MIKFFSTPTVRQLPSEFFIFVLNYISPCVGITIAIKAIKNQAEAIEVLLRLIIAPYLLLTFAVFNN
jgi:hypothetical protein